MDLKNSKILITGAAGKLGRQLVFELERRGIKPIAHVRSTSDTTYLDLQGLEIRKADLRQEVDLKALVQGVDAIIHTAAYVDFRGDRLTQFTGINTFGAVNLFKEAQAAGVKRFVHVSTVAAIGAVHRRENGERLGHPAPPLAREETEFNLEHLRIPYIQTKRAAEVELANAAASGSTELVTVNPSIVVAPSRTGDDRAKGLKLLGRFVVPYVPNRVNLVDIRDLAPGIISALEKGKNGERYILAGDDITGRELVLAVSSVLERIPHLIQIPRPFLDVTARFSLWCTKVFGRSKLRFYPDLVRLLDYDWAYSSLKARNELGYSHRSIHVTLNDLLTNNFVGTSYRPVP